MPSFQILLKSGKSMLTVLISRIRYASIFQTLKTCLQQTTKIITFHQLAVFTDSKPYLFAVYHTLPGGPGRWPQNSPAGRKPFAKTFN